MTAKSESQLIVEILAELDTLYGKFSEQNTDLATLVAAVSTLVTTLDTVLDTVQGNVGTGTDDSITADLVILATAVDGILDA